MRVYLLFSFCFDFFLGGAVLGIELMALAMIAEHSAAKLHPQRGGVYVYVCVLPLPLIYSSRS